MLVGAPYLKSAGSSSKAGHSGNTITRRLHAAGPLSRTRNARVKRAPPKKDPPGIVLSHDKKHEVEMTITAHYTDPYLLCRGARSSLGSDMWRLCEKSSARNVSKADATA